MYLLVKGTAGLGNRLLCLLTALAYARVTGRTLLVDWADPMFSNSGEDAFPFLFRCPDVGRRPPDLASRSIWPAVWKGRLSMTPMQLLNEVKPAALGRYWSHRLASVDVSRVDYSEEVLVFWSWDAQLHRFWQHLDGDLRSAAAHGEFALLCALARRHLQPSSEVEEFILAEQMDTRARQIGVHIRHTDRRAPVGKVLRALDRLLDIYPDARVFLATDSQSIQMHMRTAYDRVSVMKKSFAADGKPIHLNFTDRDRRQSAIEAVAEMFLLARSDHLVYASRSTFSYVAHLLSGLPHSSVHDVDRYNPVLFVKRALQRYGHFGPHWLYGSRGSLGSTKGPA